MKIISKLTLLLILALTTLLSGCESTDDLTWENLFKTQKSKDDEKEEVRFMLTFHEVVKYPRASNIEREITTFDGRRIWINVHQFLSSKNIEDVELIPIPDREGFYDLNLKIDRRGQILFLQMSGMNKTGSLVVLLDGQYLCDFNPAVTLNKIEEEQQLMPIKGPFNAVTADGIKKYAKQNYTILNPSVSKLF